LKIDREDGTLAQVHKFVWNEFECPKDGPKGEGQDARSKSCRPDQITFIFQYVIEILIYRKIANFLQITQVE